MSGLLRRVAPHHRGGVPRLRQLAHGSVVRGSESGASFERWADWSQWRSGDPVERSTELRPMIDLLELLALRGPSEPAPWLLPLLPERLQAPRSAPGRAPAPRVRAAAERLFPRLGHLQRIEAEELLRAVVTGAPVEIDYVDGSGSPTTRVVEQLSDTGHLLVGHCRLRQEERMFVPVGVLAVRRVG